MVTVCAPAAAAIQRASTSQSAPTPAVHDRRRPARPLDRITPDQTDRTIAAAPRPVAPAESRSTTAAIDPSSDALSFNILRRTQRISPQGRKLQGSHRREGQEVDP